MSKTGILLIDCPDRKGIAAAVADFLYKHNANILHADQHQDGTRGLFLMRVEWDLDGFDLDLDDCARQFTPIAERFGMRWRIERSDRPHRVALFVSKYDHCLAGPFPTRGDCPGRTPDRDGTSVAACRRFRGASESCSSS